MDDNKISTTEELAGVEFKTAFKGYNIAEVNEYILTQRSEADELRAENADLYRKIEKLTKEIKRIKKSDADIKKSIEDAKVEADKIIKDAKKKAAQELLRAGRQRSGMLAEMSEQLEEQKRLYTATKNEAARFRADLFARYRDHIELINAMSEASGAFDEEGGASISEKELEDLERLMDDEKEGSEESYEQVDQSAFVAGDGEALLVEAFSDTASITFPPVPEKPKKKKAGRAAKNTPEKKDVPRAHRGSPELTANKELFDPAAPVITKREDAIFGEDSLFSEFRASAVTSTETAKEDLKDSVTSIEDITDDLDEESTEDFPEDMADDLDEEPTEDFPEDMADDLDETEDFPEDMADDLSEEPTEDFPEDMTDDLDETEEEIPTEESKAEAPKAEAPKAEAPKTEAPKAEAPKAEAPKAEAPKAEAPKAEAPKMPAVQESLPQTSAVKKARVFSADRRAAKEEKQTETDIHQMEIGIGDELYDELDVYGSDNAAFVITDEDMDEFGNPDGDEMEYDGPVSVDSVFKKSKASDISFDALYGDAAPVTAVPDLTEQTPSPAPKNNKSKRTNSYGFTVSAAKKTDPDDDSNEFYMESDEEFDPGATAGIPTGTVSSFGISATAPSPQTKRRVKKSKSLTDEFDAIKADQE